MAPPLINPSHPNHRSAQIVTRAWPSLELNRQIESVLDGAFKGRPWRSKSSLCATIREKLPEVANATGAVDRYRRLQPRCGVAPRFGGWSAEEDATILRMHAELPAEVPSRWQTIAAELPGRGGKQIRQRFHGRLERRAVWRLDAD
jgi:hypothetical protein